MRAFPKLRDTIFRVRYGFRGAPFRVADREIRLDESLRRWDMAGEAPVQEVFLKHLRPGDCVMDVGANFGLHTLLAGLLVRPGGKVLAFEPLPSNFQRLKHHIRLNHLEQVVEAIPSAVSDSPDPTLEMFSGAEELGVTASLRKSDGNTRGSWVPNTCLDDFLPKLVKPVRLIKIDVEGAELSVLRGAEKLLQAHHPVLVIEVHAFAFPSFQTSLPDFLAFLERFGYRETRLPGNLSQTGLHYQAVYQTAGGNL